MDEKGLNPEVLLRRQWILWSALLGGPVAFLGVAQISMVPPLAMFFRMKPSIEKLDAQARSLGL
jgi:hypothetical protein